MAEQFLDRAQVRAVSQKMRGKGVAQRVRMQVPIRIYEADVFFHDAADGALRESPSSIIQEHRFGVRRCAAAGARACGLQ